MFTKVVGDDGQTKKFIDLSPDVESNIMLKDGTSFVPRKLRINPLEMSIDLTDQSFSRKS